MLLFYENNYHFRHNLDKTPGIFSYSHMLSFFPVHLNMVKSLSVLIFTLSVLGGTVQLSECSPLAYALPLKLFLPLVHSARGRGLIWDRRTPLRSGLLQLCPFSLLPPPLSLYSPLHLSFPLLPCCSVCLWSKR